MLDFLFDTENFLDDYIDFTIVSHEIMENMKKQILDNQAKYVDLYTRVKDENLRKLLREQQSVAYNELLKTDKQIEESQKILTSLKKIKKKYYRRNSTNEFNGCNANWKKIQENKKSANV